MITQDLQHPDVLGWEVDEDLRRANMILTARTGADRTQHGRGVDFARREAKIEYVPKKTAQWTAAESQSPDSLRRGSGHEELASHHSRDESTSRTSKTSRKEESNEYPASPQGGWRPWVFAATGFIGGNIAMSMGGVSPNYLPTIIISEIVLGVAICIAFYPRSRIPAKPSHSPL